MIEENFISARGDGVHTWTNAQSRAFTADELEFISADLHLSEQEHVAIEHVIAVLASPRCTLAFDPRSGLGVCRKENRGKDGHEQILRGFGLPAINEKAC